MALRRGQQPQTAYPETKVERFYRLAEGRINAALRDLQNIRKLANREVYEYRDDKVAEMLGALRREIDTIEESFQTGREVTGFKFSKDAPFGDE